MGNKGIAREIKSISNMRNMLSGISYDSVIVWDLDNTILQSRHELGSDQWFGVLLAIAKSQLGVNFKFQLMQNLYNQVQSLVDIDVIEHDTIKIIKYLHRIGVPQWLVTARNLELREVTLRQLEKCHIYFDAQCMIFCDGQDKGMCLENTFARLGYEVPHLVMIDDKPYNVESLRQAAIRMNSRFNGFIYEFLHEKVRAFDVGHAHFQLSLIVHLLNKSAQDFIKSLDLSWKKEHVNANDILRFANFVIELDPPEESEQMSPIP